ncbi:MAG: O-methyltransferase [Lachnospiraceae bacterium]|nr:O-methyltransferase [Lachnospiraceae bacterium]
MSRISEYLHSLEKEEDKLLSDMRKYAEVNDVPIVRRETESFLRTLCVMKKPEEVLEIGTAIAYSTIVLARESGHVTTIENYEKRIPIARENIEKSGLSDKIDLICGDAGRILPELSADGKKFDFIFLDAAKGQYLIWLPDILRIMSKGGILVSDNVLQDETVMESRFTVGRRDRTTHMRMREFLYEIKHLEYLETSVIPIGDGVSVSVRR